MSYWIHFHENVVWKKSEEEDVICQAKDMTKLNRTALKKWVLALFPKELGIL